MDKHVRKNRIGRSAAALWRRTVRQFAGRTVRLVSAVTLLPAIAIVFLATVPPVEIAGSGGWFAAPAFAAGKGSGGGNTGGDPGNSGADNGDDGGGNSGGNGGGAGASGTGATDATDPTAPDDGTTDATDPAKPGDGAKSVPSPDQMTDDELEAWVTERAAGAGAPTTADPVLAALARLLEASNAAGLSADEEAAAIADGWEPAD